MSGENGNRDARMDRIERAFELLIADHEQFRHEHKQLLTAQVLHHDTLDKLLKVSQELTLQIELRGKQIARQGKQIEGLASRFEERNESIDLRLDKIVSAFGEFSRRLPT